MFKYTFSILFWVGLVGCSTPSTTLKPSLPPTPDPAMATTVQLHCEEKCAVTTSYVCIGLMYWPNKVVSCLCAPLSIPEVKEWYNRTGGCK